MKSRSRIVIDATSRILFSSFYIQGLYESFGKNNVSFGRQYFGDLKRTRELFSFNHYFAFVKICDGKVTRYVIDFSDPPDISSEAYEWCDVYAKINFEPGAIDEDIIKVKVIPPSFGIRIWSLPETVFHCAQNLFSCFNTLPVSRTQFIRDYWQHYRRLPMSKFIERSAKKENYVFSAATLWTITENAERTNGYRRKFINVCKSVGSIRFEGGLYARKNHPDYLKYRDVIIDKPYSFTDFLNNTKKSMFVFSTPAVHDCHSWKLAEFMAFGCAIISSKLSYNFTKPLRHGEHVHFISSQEELADAINVMIDRPDYRKGLGDNARQYFEDHMTPKAVIDSLMAI